MNQSEIQKTKQAGEIAKQVREYAKTIIKKDVPLLEIANKIEEKIIELGGELAFPCSLGIDEVAAHSTPTHDDETLASGLLKIDFGVHIDGFIADTAFSLDLESSEQNKKIIETSEKALANAIEAIKQNKSLGEIGQTIQETAEAQDLATIRNLSGHSIEEANIHAGITIPNYNNNNQTTLEDGTYAIEPFITTGQGIVQDGKESGIYEIVQPKNVRDSNAREVLTYIIDEYGSLPFCSRWLVKKFGTRALLSLRLIEQTGSLHQFPQLIEKSKAPVAQSEHTLIIQDGKVEVTTD